ncbi:hypothetical protein JXA80_00270 [bacterium]|nr:hypothetical protein [candidate division CSSED10-310 bacterium]
MGDEKVRILKMVEEGKLSPEEAVKLLEVLEVRSASSVPAMVMPDPKPRRWMRFLKIRVYEGDFSKPKVNIAVPLGLLKLATKFMPEDAKAQINEHNIDLDEILRAVDENTQGKLLEVEDDEDKTRVEIFIE